jgi:hypothetical protein
MHLLFFVEVNEDDDLAVARRPKDVTVRDFEINKTGPVFMVFDKICPIWFRKLKIIYCSKNIFSRFLRFIDQFLSILKTGIVSVFESLVTVEVTKKSSGELLIP